MDGDSIIMNPNDGKHIRIVEEQLLQQEQHFMSPPDIQQGESREGRFTSFHRRARLRSEVDIGPAAGATESSAVGDVLTPVAGNGRITGCVTSFMGSFFYCLFQIGILVAEVLFSVACNPRLWSVAWIAVSAATEIFIYLVLALATVFVAVIINIYEGSRRDVRLENEGRSERERTPKSETVMQAVPPTDVQTKSIRIQNKD